MGVGGRFLVFEEGAIACVPSRAHVCYLTLKFCSRFQQRLSTELLSSLATCLVEGQIFQIVSMLQEVQNAAEKQLFSQRLTLQKKFHEEKADFQRHYQKKTTGITGN